MKKLKMSEYTFYFDESFHDRKIGFNDKTGLNIRSDNSLDTFIGLFWGCRTSKVPTILEKLSNIEKKHKSILNIPANSEFKTVSINKKNFIRGIKSFNDNVLGFYTDVFQFIDDMDLILQADLISKTEFFVRNIFPVSNDSIQYSLTKFIIHYGNNDLFAALENARNSRTNDILRRELIKNLITIMDATKNIPRKEREYQAYRELLFFVSSYKFDMKVHHNYKFDYSPNFDGLIMLLEERGIHPDECDLCIDYEFDIISRAMDYPFHDVRGVTSDKCVQVRLSDWLSGFIGRMIFAMVNDPNMREDPVYNIEDIIDNDLERKRLLSEDWFKIDEIRFELYKLISKALFSNHSDYYWVYLTCNYFDQMAMFASFVQYIASYDDYREFANVDSTSHAKYVNSMCCEMMSKRFSEFLS